MKRRERGRMRGDRIWRSSDGTLDPEICKGCKKQDKLYNRALPQNIIEGLVLLLQKLEAIQWSPDPEYHRGTSVIALGTRSCTMEPWPRIS